MSPPRSKRNSGNAITTIDKLDYPPNSPRRPLLAPDDDAESQRRSNDTSYETLEPRRCASAARDTSTSSNGSVRSPIT